VFVGGLAVEQEEHDGLEGGYYQFLVAFGDLGFDLAVCESVLEFKLAAGVLGLVVCFELVDG